jgi:hypothetical protein
MFYVAGTLWERKKSGRRGKECRSEPSYRVSFSEIRILFCRTQLSVTKHYRLFRRDEHIPYKIMFTNLKYLLSVNQGPLKLICFLLSE